MFLRFIWVCVLLLLLVIGGIAGITGGALYSFYSELPDIDRLENFRPSLVTKVYDRNKEVIGEFFIEKRELIAFDDIPKDFVNALLAVEDKRFWEHEGVDPVGIARAIIVNLQHRGVSEGASMLS